MDNMYRSIQTAVALVIVSAATPALAGDFDYNYLEAGWLHTNQTSAGETGDGFDVAGSVALGANAHGFAQFGDQDFGHGVRLYTYEVGAGFNRSLTSGLDLVGNASYVRGQTDVSGGSNFTDEGWSIAMLLRGQLAEQVELDGGIKYTDLHQAGSATTFNIDTLFFLAKNFTAVAGLSFNDQGNVLRVGVRYSFGN
jgi:hypothetical protein